MEHKLKCAFDAQFLSPNGRAIGAYWDESNNGCWVITSDESVSLNENEKARRSWGCLFNGKRY